jgi:lipopolysaccharide/colanic/teichoic acid biosynthesis glycosyltransferase
MYRHNARIKIPGAFYMFIINIYVLVIKRAFDLFVSILLVPLFVLIFFPVAFAIKFNSKGSVIYKSKKIGRNLVEFDMYKFRTMNMGSEMLGGYSTNVGDPRVTKVGAFLRKYSLDELPQIFNVIKGQMSLIGPRPDVIKQAKEIYTREELLHRQRVLPGITGLAQSRNRHGLSIDHRKRYDFFYVDHVNFMLDLKIMLWTIKTLYKKSY